jgi:Sigma-70, region 4
VSQPPLLTSSTTTHVTYITDAGSHRLAVLQLLPPRQRAVLVLRDVLAWPTTDICGLLKLSDPAVNIALQRALATLRNHRPTAHRDTWTGAAATLAERDVLDRYIRAYETADTQAALALLADDVRVTMPPAPYLFEGRDLILQLAGRARETGSWRLLPTSANRPVRSTAGRCWRRCRPPGTPGRPPAARAAWGRGVPVRGPRRPRLSPCRHRVACRR